MFQVFAKVYEILKLTTESAAKSKYVKAEFWHF